MAVAADSMSKFEGVVKSHSRCCCCRWGRRVQFRFTLPARRQVNKDLTPTPAPTSRPRDRGAAKSPADPSTRACKFNAQSSANKIQGHRKHQLSASLQKTSAVRLAVIARLLHFGQRIMRTKMAAYLSRPVDGAPPFWTCWGEQQLLRSSERRSFGETE